MVVVNLVLYWIWMLGAHEPLYFGWQAYLVLSAVTNVMSALIGLYVTYSIARANYIAANLGGEFPSWSELFFKLLAVFLSLCNVVSVIVVLATDHSDVNALRHVSITVLALFISGYLEYSFISLRRQVKQLYKDSVSRAQHTPNKNRDIVLADTNQPMDSDAQLDSEIKVGDEISEDPVNASENSRITERILKKVTVLLVAVPIVAAAVIATLLYAITQTVSHETYSKSVDTESREYSGVDMFYYVNIILMMLYQYYAYQGRNDKLLS
eukprot:CAMPEP_0167740180 /NCGR_PEP_ID=MMETSP0110_2-20121227/128_1 /TAXON_ID=629695 /ORGANISM="Gymnochlora sp., Strain CCMP2014" /LENGTH=267 /DNA_ID=CAMNT_0007624033 /DNA_START=142 /DNA_END=945 /DNA_ORIENTATION=-